MSISFSLTGALEVAAHLDQAEALVPLLSEPGVHVTGKKVRARLAQRQAELERDAEQAAEMKGKGGL